MVGLRIFEQIKPERRQLGEYVALVRNRVGHHHVEGGDAVRSHQHHLAVHVIHVAHFAPREQMNTRERTGLQQIWWRAGEGIGVKHRPVNALPDTAGT